MYSAQSFDQNSIVQGTFLGSKYLNPIYLFNHGYAFFHNLFSIIFSNQVVNIFYTILFILSTFFLGIIFYSGIRVLEIRKKEKKHLEQEIAEYAHRQAERDKIKQAGESGSKNERWMKVLTHLFSQSSSDWRMSIMEADAMLDELMGELGFKGENLGEKLKGTDQEKFRNLTIAWEAHTIRNRLAHEGLSYPLSQHEAKRVISLYEKIFRELGYI